jgi:hypothetical protein
MEVSEFLSLAAVAGILSATVSALLNYGVKHLERRSAARFLALELAILLERYALELYRSLYEHRNFVSSDGANGTELIYPAKLPEYPQKPDVWPALSPSMANRTLGFRAELDQETFDLREIYDYMGEEGEWYALKMAAKFGHDAIILSRDLRHTYGLPQTPSGNELLGKLAAEVVKANAT